jgi:Undecaprenyl-phosphate galactose phosphotransferase WbaP
MPAGITTGPVSTSAQRMQSVAQGQTARSSPTSSIAAAPELAWMTARRHRLTWLRFSRVLLLLAADWSAVVISGLAGAFLWGVLVRAQPLDVYLAVAPLSLLFPIAYAKWGLYPGFGLGAVETLRRLSLASGFIFLVLAGFIYAFRIPHHFSRMAFLIAFVLTLVAVPLGRFFLLSLTRKLTWWQEPTVLVGNGALARRIERSLSASLSLGYRPVGYLTEAPETDSVPSALGSLSDAPSVAKSGVRVAIVAGESTRNRPEVLSFLQEHFRHVIIVPEDQGIPVEGAQICNLGGILGVEFLNRALRKRNRILKRSLDLLLSTGALLLTAPLMGLAAFLVKAVSKGPVLYFQEREGLEGARIRVPKIRTMFVDADARLRTYVEANSRAREEWSKRYKLLHDPRVLPGIGRFLRRFSIDELPQLWKVVTGEMSLVGPRPFPHYHLEAFPEDFRLLRQRVRPGLTGLWQVMVRSSGGLEEQILYDTYYIRNWSLWLDLYIILRSFGAVIRGKGAH